MSERAVAIQTLESQRCCFSFGHSSSCRYSCRSRFKVAALSTSCFADSKWRPSLPNSKWRPSVLAYSRWRPSQPHCCLGHSFSDSSWEATFLNPKKMDPEIDVKFSSMGMSTKIDWLNLSDEEFDEQLNNIRRRVPNFVMSMLCEEERNKFWSRRNTAALKVAREFSNIVGNTDLITPLEKLRKARGGDRFLEFANVDLMDEGCSEIPDEQFLKSEVEDAAIAIVGCGSHSKLTNSTRQKGSITSYQNHFGMD